MIRRDVEPQRRSTAEGRLDKADPRSAGASAWDHARALAGPRARRERAAARRYQIRRAVVAVAVVVVSWSVAAVSSQLRTAAPPAAAIGALLCAGLVIAGGRRVRADSRCVTEARRTASSLAAVAASSFSDIDDAASQEHVAVHTNLRDGGYWMAVALTRRRTAVALQRLAPTQCWWHDVQMHADPSIVFDHVAVGTSGAVFVHDVVVSPGQGLTVDGVNGVSYAGYPIGRPGAEQLMAWQLRAASTLARAVGLPLSAVTVIAIVTGTDLFDIWGARTELEELLHTEAQIALAYCTPQRLPAALLTDCDLEPDVANLAAHQLAEAIAPNVTEVIHRPIARSIIALRHRRRCGLSEQEVRHG